MRFACLRPGAMGAAAASAADQWPKRSTGTASSCAISQLITFAKKDSELWIASVVMGEVSKMGRLGRL